MYNGANEDTLRYGSVDSNEYLKAKYGMKSHIESLEGVIKLLSAQIVQRDDLLKRVYERIDSEVLRKEVDNIIPKWYDNIPEHDYYQSQLNKVITHPEQEPIKHTTLSDEERQELANEHRLKSMRGG